MTNTNNTDNNAGLDIVAIGNPVVDMLAHVPDAFLASHGLSKGATHLRDEHAIDLLCEELPEAWRCSGGSAANTIVALSELGMKTAFIGRVANDAYGESFVRDIREAGVTFNPTPAETGKPTARCAVCVTPDGERTMSVYIGACAEFMAEDLEEDYLEQARMVYIEGYLWDAPEAKHAISHAIHIAREHGKEVAMTLSDIFCVNRHREDFLDLVEHHVDVLFANEEEALALYQEADPYQVIRMLGQHVKTVVITRSSEPALAWHAGELVEVAPTPITHVEDATGAGDLFAAGCLYGLLNAHSIEASIRCGHVLAGHIIQQLGARSASHLRTIITEAEQAVEE